MKLVRNDKGPQPMSIPRLGVSASAGDVVEISEDQREVGQNLIDQRYFSEVIAAAAPVPPPAAVKSKNKDDAKGDDA